MLLQISTPLAITPAQHIAVFSHTCKHTLSSSVSFLFHYVCDFEVYSHTEYDKYTALFSFWDDFSFIKSLTCGIRNCWTKEASTLCCKHPWLNRYCMLCARINSSLCNLTSESGSSLSRRNCHWLYAFLREGSCVEIRSQMSVRLPAQGWHFDQTMIPLPSTRSWYIPLVSLIQFCRKRKVCRSVRGLATRYNWAWAMTGDLFGVWPSLRLNQAVGEGSQDTAVQSLTTFICLHLQAQHSRQTFHQGRQGFNPFNHSLIPVCWHLLGINLHAFAQ